MLLLYNTRAHSYDDDVCTYVPKMTDAFRFKHAILLHVRSTHYCFLFCETRERFCRYIRPDCMDRFRRLRWFRLRNPSLSSSSSSTSSPPPKPPAKLMIDVTKKEKDAVDFFAVVCRSDDISGIAYTVVCLVQIRNRP